MSKPGLVTVLVWGAVLFCAQAHCAHATGSQSAHFSQGELTGKEIFLLYQEALGELDSFSFDSRYLWTAGGKTIGDCTLRCSLKRPGFYRVEVIDRSGESAGLLICDGTSCWKLWPQGTGYFTQHTGTWQVEREIYMKERAYPGKSVSHQLSLLPHVCMPVFNANVFFGGAESVMEYLDDVELVGEETIGNEPCHVLRVSMMKGQRVRTYWLSKRDHLPRKLFGELVVANPQTTTEVWEKVALDPALDDALFAWAPPEGWEERRPLTLMDRLLQVGDEAADFTLDDAAGKPLALADYKGKIIWLMFWRIG